jgi:hypothetical protein
MTRKSKEPSNDRLYPANDSPVIFSLKQNPDMNFIGRYIKEEAMFLLSLNDEESDFVARKDVAEWHYVLEHPTIIKECSSKKRGRKTKKTDMENKQEENNVKSFSAPQLPPLPPFLHGFVNHLQQQMGHKFEMINVKFIGDDELDTLPTEALEQIRAKAVEDENFELATKIRDIITSKNKEDGK